MIDFIFSWWQYEFMRNAFFALLLIMPLFALLGTLVVNNGLSFFSDALGHSALTGVGIGMILGVSDFKISMVVFAVIFALLMNKIRYSKTSSSDTVIGVFSSSAVALGLILLSKKGGFSSYQNILIGDILSIGKNDIVILIIMLVCVVVLWIFMFNSFYAVSLNSSLAKTKGLKTMLIDNIFVVAVSVVVMMTIQWVGLLIVNAMLVIPAAAARNVSKNLRMYFFLSIVFSVFSGIMGLVFSFYNAISTGPLIVLVAAALYFGTFFLKGKAST